MEIKIDLIFLILFSFIFFYFGGKISIKFKLLDYPNKRKMHKYPIPFSGGLIISIIFLITVYLSNFNEFYNNNILVYGFLVALFGLIDDKFNVNVGSKLILQLLPILILVYLNQLKIDTLIGFPFLGDINLGSFNYIFTILCVYLLLNSSNYLDGIDGSLSISFLISLIFLFIFIDEKNFELRDFITYLIIPVVIFLLFNFGLFNLPKIFLGNSGSQLLGYILAFTIISSYINYNVDLGILIWLLSFQVYEFVSINLIRLQKRKKIFKPAKDHIHHLIFNKSKSIFLTNIILLFVQIILIAYGSIVNIFFGQEISITFFVILFFIFYMLRKRL